MEGKRSRESKRCQVLGCMFDLAVYGKRYHLKKRLCPEHLNAEAVQLCDAEGLFRFCQQCGKLERLELFAGTKRSCRYGLEKRRINHAASTARQQQQQQQQRGSVADDSAQRPLSPCAASCSECSSASLTEMPAGSLTAACYSADTAAAAAAAAAAVMSKQASIPAAAAAAAAVPLVTQQILKADSIEEMLWEELHKELQVPASTAAAAAGQAGQAGPLPHAAAEHDCMQQQLERRCSSNVAAAAAPAAAAPAAVGFDYSAVDYTNEESLNRLEQMIELEIMQALLQPQAPAVPAAAAAPAAPAPAAPQAARLQRSAALLEQVQAVSAELQQLQAAVAALQGMQQQQQPEMSLASSWDAWCM